MIPISQKDSRKRTCSCIKHTLIKKNLIASLFFIILFILSIIKAQSQSLDWYQSTTTNVLANARNLIEPTLPQDERSIAEKIHYIVTGSSAIGAFAAEDNQQPVIIIHAGTIQIMDWFSDLIMIASTLNNKECYKEYLSYFAEKMKSNTQAVADNLPLTPTAPPLAYAATSTGNCSHITLGDMMNIKDYGQTKAKMIEASIMFLYLHELGHHVLGHVTGKASDNPLSLEMSQQQEENADMFAIKTALNANYNLVAAAPWNVFMAVFGGNSVEAEKHMDHPLGIKRVLHIFDGTIHYYEDQPDKWHGQISYEEMMKNLIEQRDEIAIELSELPQ